MIDVVCCPQALFHWNQEKISPSYAACVISEGQQVATGVYFGHLQAGSFEQTIKMVLYNIQF